MKEEYIFNIDGEQGERLDVFLSGEIEKKSRSAIQKLIETGDILVNGKIAKSNYKIRANDEIRLLMPPPLETDIKPEDIPLDIVYEDKDLIIINKPKGMVVHLGAGHYSGTLVNALMYHCKDELSGINGALRPGIVHRIDKDTTGILVAAKNDNAHIKLSQQFAVHSIKRKYEGIAFNTIKEDHLKIDAPIGRNPNDRKKMCVTLKNAKNAVTYVDVLERFSKFTYFQAQLETGRTHQIRVHLSHKGHPLLGDLTYGYKKQPFKLEGQALHAKMLGFTHPSTGAYMEFEREAPAYFKELLKKLH